MTPLMQTVIETYQIQLGIENDMLQHPIMELYTDSAWIRQLTSAMNIFNITIFWKNAMRLNKQREHDICIIYEVPQHN